MEVLVSDHLQVGSVRSEWLRRLPAEGRDLTTPYPPLTAEDRWRYREDGDRVRYEAVVAERHRLLSAAVLAAAATGGDVAVDRLVEGVLLFCDQDSWCWPAHDDWDPTRPFLDLGAGEVAAQLAWADQLAGALMEVRCPGIRARMAQEVQSRVLGPFLERDDWHWLGLDGDVHNWLPWIAGNVLTAALVLSPDAGVRGDVIARVEQCLWRYVDSLPADGAVDEGYGYWWNGVCRALEAFELLEHATGGDRTQWRHHPTLQATIRFPLAMHLGGRWWVNVADSSAQPSTDLAWPSLFRAARALGDAEAETLAVSRRTEVATSEVRRLGRLVLELADEGWWQALSADVVLPREVWYPSVQLLIARERRGGPGGLTLVAKGGHNGEHHNHNDVGSFIVALDGVPVVVDLGRPAYTAQTFSPDRYSIWVMQSASHNVPVIRGALQPAGAEFAARDVEVERSDGAVGLAMDLVGAYPDVGIDSWRRTLRLDRAAGRIVCRDDWAGDAGAGRSASAGALVVAGTVRRVGAGEVIVTPVEGGRALRILSDKPLSIERRTLTDQMLTQVWGSCVHQIKSDLGRDNISQASMWFEAAKQEVAR